MDQQALIGIVGPCKSGKTTLCDSLLQAGYNVRAIKQEHSFVKDMWQRLSNPAVLIFLDVSYPKTLQRSQLKWTEEEFNQQGMRLSHARENANILIDTDDLSTEQVFQKVVLYLTNL